MTRTVFLLLALTLAVPGGMAYSEPPPKPPALVVNPEAEAWAGFAPGAWVLLETTEREPVEGTEAVPAGQATPPLLRQLVVLAERTDHEVVLWTRTDVDGEQGPGQARQHDRRVAGVEARQRWQREDVQGDVEVRKERWNIGTRSVTCTVRSWATKDAWNEHWQSPEVPGGEVQSIVVTSDGDEERTIAVAVTGFGTTPSGDFKWPLVWRPEERLVSNPAASGWTPFKPGAWVRWSMKDSAARDPKESVHVRRLVEVRPTRVILERIPAEDSPWGGGNLPLRVPAHEVNDPEANEALGYKTTITKGRETLTIAGKSFDCETEFVTSVSKTDGSVIQVRRWVHRDVPGHEVKRQVVMESSGPAFTITSVALDWGLTSP